MDAIYYISSTLMTLTFIGIIIVTILSLIKPHFLGRLIRRPITRPMIAMMALVALVISMVGYGGVLAATEPASIKEARIAKQATQQEQERKAEEEAEALRKREEEAKKPIVKTETKKQSIPFSSITQDDDTLEQGKTRISVEGVEGERIITYEVTYIQGEEMARKEISRKTIKEPMKEVTQVGTYVTPVYTPTQTPQYQTQSSGRVGAICSDGWQSSATGRGACSHHGGVSYWLYE